MTIKINGYPLPDDLVEAELMRLLKTYAKRMSEEEIRERLPKIKQQAKDFAIGRFLLHAEAISRKIEPDEAAIQREMTLLKNEHGGEENFQKILEQTKHTEQDVMAVVKAALQIDMLVKQIVSGVKPPMESEIENYYNANPDEFQQPEAVHVSHILIKPESKEDKAVVISRLLEIKEQVKQGADFAELAAVYSQCPSGKRSGGDLGIQPRGTMVAAFEDVAFDMEIGEISEPVETEFGFHIIYKKDHFPARTLSLEEARDEIARRLVAVWQNDMLEDFISRLKQAVHIEDTEKND